MFSRYPILALLVFQTTFSAAAQIRTVSYNTLAGPATATEEQLAREIFGAIGGRSANGVAKQPDIIGLQEQFTGSPGSTGRLTAALNAEFGVNSYQATAAVGGGSFQLAYVYDASTVTPISSTSVPVGIRPGLRTRWRPVGYDAAADFYTYDVHLKAGDAFEGARANEATALRNDADALGDGEHIIYMGDFNFAGSTEAGYANLLAAGNGQAFDPVSLSSWPSLTSRQYLTQSTRDTSLPDGGAFGGLDDRFDLQLVSDEMLDGEGLSYMGPTSTGFAGGEHSYIAFGNDGMVFDVAINAFSAGREQPAAVLDALHDLSDHLPVVADYQLPAKMQVSVDIAPATVIRGASVSVGFEVENVAPVVVAVGADELDYTYSTTGDLSGAGSGMDAAAGGVQSETISLNTATPGVRSGSLSVEATSQQAADALFSQSLNVTVLDHANASFDDASDQNTLVLDLGDFAVGGPTTPGGSFDIHNLVSAFGAGLTADLDLDAIVESDPDTKFAVTGPTLTGLAAGESKGFSVTGVADEQGGFNAAYTFDLSDEDLDGAATEQLVLNVSFDVVGLLGDMNGDAALTNGDISDFVLALTDASAYTAAHPDLDPDILGDFTGDAALTNGDIAGFVDALTGGGPLSAEQASLFEEAGLLAVPEPGTLGLWLMSMLGLGVRRRRACSLIR